MVARALEILRDEDELLVDNKSVLADKLDQAFDQFERGEFLTSSQSKADMERRKDEWLRSNGGSAEAQDDLFEILRHIANDSGHLAN